MGASGFRRALARARMLALGVAAAVLVAPAAQATESGSSLYLLGSGGPGAGVVPPIKGLFLDNTVYHYEARGGGEKQFTVGGNLVAGLKANINADFATLLFVPETNILGGVLGVGAAVPVGDVAVDVSAVLTGPRGGTALVTASDSKTMVGDPILMTTLGWTRGKTHLALSGMVNLPVGHYREDQLANLAFHRWAADTSLAVTWLDPQAGWDLSGKMGLTLNGANHWTDYDSGNEFHVEGSIEKKLSPVWSLGAQAYYLEQVTGDEGRGATLGAFKGRVSGVGLTGAYDFKVAGKPASLRLRAMTEFDARNRPEGDSVWLDFSMPLWIKAP